MYVFTLVSSILVMKDIAKFSDDNRVIVELAVDMSTYAVSSISNTSSIVK